MGINVKAIGRGGTDEVKFDNYLTTCDIVMDLLQYHKLLSRYQIFGVLGA